MELRGFLPVRILYFKITQPFMQFVKCYPGIAHPMNPTEYCINLWENK